MSCQRLRRAASVAYAVVLAASWTASVQAQPLRLSLGSLTLREANAKVQFLVVGEEGSPVAVDELPLNTERFSSSHTASFAVYADLQAIRPGKYIAEYQYELIVVPRSDADGARRFQVKGVPIGSFMDSVVEVEYEVGRGDTVEAGTLRLPVFSFSSPPLLEYERPARVVETSLGRDLEVPIPLRNLMEGLPMRVRTVDRPMMNGGSWTELGFSRVGQVGTQHEIEIPPGGRSGNDLKIVGQPAPLAALRGAFNLVPPGHPHERIRFSLDYSSWGGIERPLAVEIPIRFVPSPPSLLLALLAGTVVGSLASLTLSGNRLRTWPRAFATAMVLALIAEGVAMVLVVADSRFRLLGLELDPFQLLPTFMIGALVGLGGFRTLRLYQNLRSGSRKPAGPEADGADSAAGQPS